MRKCSKCKKEKEDQDFSKHKGNASGFDYECKKCKYEFRKEWAKKNPEWIKSYDKKRALKNKDKNNERAKKWYQANKEVVLAKRKVQYKENPNSYEEDRKAKLKTRYNTTPEYVEELRTKQNNKCAICYKEFTLTPHVDHCHKTGRVRGLLCKHCNTAIGLLNDDPDLLDNASEYCSRMEA